MVFGSVYVLTNAGIWFDALIMQRGVDQAPPNEREPKEEPGPVIVDEKVPAPLRTCKNDKPSPTLEIWQRHPREVN